MVHLDPATAPWRELDALIQQGVWCRAATPVPLLAFLTGALGLDEAYVRTRVETIFLDGMVVDDLEGSVVQDRSTVTLSAAMPGLVGATLRRGGYYRTMRAEISWSTLAAEDEAGATPEVAAEGLVRVKLFNLILREQGRGLLARGVLVDAGPAREALGAGIAADAAADANGRILLVVDEGGAHDEGTPCT